MSKKKKKEKLKHFHWETPRQRITFTDSRELGKEKFEQFQKIQQERQGNGIKVMVRGDDDKDYDFFIYGMETFSDAAGDPVLHIKFKDDEHLVLYLLTEHPDSRNCLETFLTTLRIHAPQLEVRDIMNDVKEGLEAMIKGEKGLIPTKPGIHPMMKQSLKDDYKELEES